jgi:hypothetical protein
MDCGFNRQSIGLFDHLVGQCEQRWWNFEADRPRGLQIDAGTNFIGA